MRALGLAGAVRGKVKKPHDRGTRRATRHPPDLLESAFTATAPIGR
ncbi:hypothetical protein [Janibacter indicus]|nr:hypothetical protein [Janibacter indicus]